MMSHFVLGQEVSVFLGCVGATERQDQVLQDVDWGLSIKEEDALGEKLPLLAVLLLLLSETSHFRCLLELLRDLILSIVLLSLLESLAGLFLHGLNLN